MGSYEGAKNNRSRRTLYFEKLKKVATRISIGLYRDDEPWSKDLITLRKDGLNFAELRTRLI